MGFPMNTNLFNFQREKDFNTLCGPMMATFPGVIIGGENTKSKIKRLKKKLVSILLMWWHQRGQIPI